MRLSQDIQCAYDHLMKIVNDIPVTKRTLKWIEGTGGKVSVADLIAYQIGWGKNLIRWYESGIMAQLPEMPGDGFSKWDYVAIANHFCQKYAYDTADDQLGMFHQVVARILEIITKEEQAGNLDRLGVWPWCTLASGKAWPLSKWIQVNTVSPYKRAALLIAKAKI